MLYRNPDLPRRAAFFQRLGVALRALHASHRRRITQIDLMWMNPHLKQDLGLRDADLRNFLNPER